MNAKFVRTASFYLSLAMIAYLILVAIIGVILGQATAGGASDAVFKAFGTLMLIGFVGSFVGLLLGIVGAIQKEPGLENRAYLGIAINGLVILLIFFSLFFGVSTIA